MFTNCSLWLYGKIRVDMLLYIIIELQCLTYKNNLQFMGAHKLALWVWKAWSHFLIHYISIWYPLPPQRYSPAFYYKCRPLPASDIFLNTLNSPLEESSTAWLRVSVSKLNILSFLNSVRLFKRKSETSKVMTSEVKCQVIILISYARVLRNLVNQFDFVCRNFFLVCDEEL